jgi:hypothetical protein
VAGLGLDFGDTLKKPSAVGPRAPQWGNTSRVGECAFS